MEATFAMKLWAATYYMSSSMVVQLMNKVWLVTNTCRLASAACRHHSTAP